MTRLAQALTEAGLTRRDLARKAGVHENTVQWLAAGRSRPRERTARRIADALDVTPGDLFDGVITRRNTGRRKGGRQCRSHTCSAITRTGLCSAHDDDRVAAALRSVRHIPPLPESPRPGWDADAACRDHPNPDLWFVADRGRQPPAEVVTVCVGCPVRADCIAAALERRERYGIYGGLTPHRLAELRRRLRGVAA